ncbi:MAG: alpha/beta hydrolase [Candidatus Omnitrophica bacterium]|nr:alpha/beta hydrolase [Candidatus Omnitrophota bacterium]MBU1925300.1 alpha/beta hydrolase [Candidatus Omnitrophota bacterium]
MIEPISASVITKDLEEIYLDHYRNKNSSVIVIAHGFFNSRKSILIRQLAQSLAERFDVITFDFRGHGDSKGLFYWTAKEYRDLEAVLDFAREKRYRRIGLVGFSLGAAISIIGLAKTKKVKSFACVSAPVDFEKIDYYFWNLDIENDIFYNLVGEGRYGKGVRPGPFWLKKDNPINLVDKIKIPILFVHGDADWVIKSWHSQLLYEKAATQHKRLVIIKGGPHAEYIMRKNEGEFVAILKDWFSETLLSQKTGGEHA